MKVTILFIQIITIIKTKMNLMLNLMIFEIKFESLSLFIFIIIKAKFKHYQSLNEFMLLYFIQVFNSIEGRIVLLFKEELKHSKCFNSDLKNCIALKIMAHLE